MGVFGEQMLYKNILEERHQKVTNFKLYSSGMHATTLKKLEQLFPNENVAFSASEKQHKYGFMCTAPGKINFEVS